MMSNKICQLNNTSLHLYNFCFAGTKSSSGICRSDCRSLLRWLVQSCLKSEVLKLVSRKSAENLTNYKPNIFFTGIGRTGVLILMETAACLVEANEPVYPIEIVKTMRDQRAMLIQTPVRGSINKKSLYQQTPLSIVRPYQLRK